MACTNVSQCPRINDCRCNNGENRAGATCENMQCFDRNATCERLCSTRDGWRPNVEGCYAWELIEASTDTNGDPGVGADFQRPQNLGCTSGVRIRVSTVHPDIGDYGWCVPTATCASGKCISQCSADSDCPTSDWTCGAPAKNGVGTNSLRLCKPKRLGPLAAPFCDMR